MGLPDLVTDGLVVVGSSTAVAVALLWNYFISEFNEMREIFLAPPCVNVRKQAAVKRQTRCMRKPMIAVCQHAAVKRQTPMYEETDDSLSEGELESTWPCSIQKYCRVQRNRKFVPVQWGRWGRLTLKRCGRGGPAGSVKTNDAATQPVGKSLTLGRREEYSLR